VQLLLGSIHLLSKIFHLLFAASLLLVENISSYKKHFYAKFYYLFVEFGLLLVEEF
jgi:hypothetical protein